MASSGEEGRDKRDGVEWQVKELEAIERKVDGQGDVPRGGC